MYLSIPRPTMEEIDDTLALLDRFVVEFQSYLNTKELDHTGIEMTGHLRRLVHVSRGALVPRELVLKLAQGNREVPVEVLQIIRNELDVFIDRTALQWQDKIRHVRDGHLLGHAMIVFNAMFFGIEAAAGAPENDSQRARSYGDFIFKFYEAQCEQALRKIRAMLRKQKIDPDCFTAEIDLYDSAGPSGTACTATYNIVGHGNLAGHKQRLLESTVREVTAPLQVYIDMPSLYAKARHEEAHNDE